MSSSGRPWVDDDDNEVGAKDPSIDIFSDGLISFREEVYRSNNDSYRLRTGCIVLSRHKSASGNNRYIRRYHLHAYESQFDAIGSRVYQKALSEKNRQETQQVLSFLYIFYLYLFGKTHNP
ncbi:hypothetical protein evm_007606 [Chilo suppressalis]|nr:hypothetical protein evm_007606 [Chilo suppressalis]